MKRQPSDILYSNLSKLISVNVEHYNLIGATIVTLSISSISPKQAVILFSISFLSYPISCTKSTCAPMFTCGTARTCKDRLSRFECNAWQFGRLKAALAKFRSRLESLTTVPIPVGGGNLFCGQRAESGRVVTQCGQQVKPRSTQHHWFFAIRQCASFHGGIQQHQQAASETLHVHSGIYAAPCSLSFKREVK